MPPSARQPSSIDSRRPRIGEETVQRWTIGDVTITQVVETTFQGLEGFLPDATPEAVLPLDWLRPHFITEEGILRFSIHAFVIDTGRRRIIVDTCVGNHKPREFFPDWHMLQTDFLRRLEDAGYPRESIDTALCTHLHLDHVGWNTMLVDGEWVPTFPNARYLIERTELAYTDGGSDDAEMEPWLRDMNATVIADSIRPVMDAGLVDRVGSDHRICDEVELVPTPGHTIGHVSVRVASRGASALITGDFIHHPCQLAHPEWSVTTDYDPAQSVVTRRARFSEVADTPTLVLGTHWPVPSAGYVARSGDAWRLDVEGGKE
ncbi:MAG: MBL fold metallo-hydrolase [Alphaproteobacteria bacterium]|nr:MBL fold metallo-hydrolase [Alphaproteobacteria bacterium]